MWVSRICSLMFQHLSHPCIPYLKDKMLDVLRVDLVRRIEPAFKVSRHSSSITDASARMAMCEKFVSGEIATKSSTTFRSKAGAVAQF